ncbi:hypothetical protein D3C81_2092410 [compost metagenome]
MEYEPVSGFRKAGNRLALRISSRITLGGQDHADSRLIAPLNVDIGKSAFSHSQKDLQQVASQPRQHNLCLRIAEARIELNRLRLAVR